MRKYFPKRFNLSDVPGGLVLLSKYELLTPPELEVRVRCSGTLLSTQGVGGTYHAENKGK